MFIHRLFHSIRPLLAFLLLSLVACGTVNPHAVITITLVPTRTVTTQGMPSPFPTGTATGNPTPSPVLSVQQSTATLWYQPRTLRLATQPSTLFPLLSEPLVSQNVTPTPINTPVGQRPSYQLKALNESDGISLINRMVDYAHAGDVYGPSTSRPGFTILQAPIRTAALEYLLRFPNSAHANSVRWRLALSNAILGRFDSDRWITEQIEQGLNDGVIDPQGISAWLAPYGFVVNTRICPTNVECSWGDNYAAAEPLITTDLFGDGGKTQIIQIQTVELVTGSMIAAMHQDSAGQFYVVPVYSGWGARYTERLGVAAQDLTGDGRPEIWVDEYYHSGSMMNQTTYLYHWLKGNQPYQGRFVEVTNGQISSDLDRNYQLVPGGDKGDQGTFTLINHHYGYSEKETYRWNGYAFVLQDRKVVFPLDIDQVFFFGGLDDAMADEQFQEVADLLQQPLASSVITDIGPSAPDYIAFQRAVNAALAYRPDEVQKNIQALLDAPANPKSAFLSIVRAYRGSYRQVTDAYRACQAAMVEYDRVTASYKDNNGYVSVEKAAEALGFTDHFYANVCNLRVAFGQLVKRLDGDHPDQYPTQLAQYGVRIDWKTQIDANGDGKADWLLDLAQPGASRTYLLLSRQGSPELVPLGPGSAGVRFEVLHLPSSDHDAYLLKTGDELKIFRVYPGQPGAAIETLVDEYGITDYQVVSDAASTDLLLSRDPKKYDPQERKHWDASLGQFIPYDAQEQELLFLKYPTQVIRDIPVLLPLLNLNTKDHYYPWLKPARLHYLLGLAYEMSGDSEFAARTYYDLWRSYPDQPYAILAREKLELVQP